MCTQLNVAWTALLILGSASLGVVVVVNGQGEICPTSYLIDELRITFRTISNRHKALIQKSAFGTVHEVSMSFTDYNVNEEIKTIVCFNVYVSFYDKYRQTHTKH